jgi:hypothetical protein
MLTVPLHTIKSRSDLAYLRYDRIPVGMKQQRLMGRFKLVPQVQLYEYQCRAVIDWIKIRVTFGQLTQHQWVQDEVEPIIGRKCHIDVIDEKPGRVSDTFEITFQEPDLRRVERACSMLDARFRLQTSPIVCALEISVDFRSRFRDQRDRARLFMALTRHFHTTRDVMSRYGDRPRFSFGRGAQNAIGVIGRKKGHPERDDHYLISLASDRVPYVDATYYVGAKQADVSWRVMDKVIDTQNRAAETFVSLEEPDKRVRIEVTLRGAAVADLGVNNLSDMKDLSLPRLQSRFFSFVLPTFIDARQMRSDFPAAAIAWKERQREQKFLNTGAIGLAAMDAALARQVKKVRLDARGDLRHRRVAMFPLARPGTGRSGSFVAYEEMNERVGVALRHLGERVAASLSRA